MLRAPWDGALRVENFRFWLEYGYLLYELLCLSLLFPTITSQRAPGLSHGGEWLFLTWGCRATFRWGIGALIV